MPTWLKAIALIIFIRMCTDTVLWFVDFHPIWRDTIIFIVGGFAMSIVIEMHERPKRQELRRMLLELRDSMIRYRDGK